MEEKCLVLFGHCFKWFSIFMSWLPFCHSWALQMSWKISVKVLLETIETQRMFFPFFKQSEARLIMTWRVRASACFPVCRFGCMFYSPSFICNGRLNCHNTRTKMERFPFCSARASTCVLSVHLNVCLRLRLRHKWTEPNPHKRFTLAVMNQL